MATDYFAMMRDTVGAYGEGVESRRQKDRQIKADERAEELYQFQRAGLQRTADINAGEDVIRGEANAFQSGESSTPKSYTPRSDALARPQLYSQQADALTNPGMLTQPGGSEGYTAPPVSPVLGLRGTFDREKFDPTSPTSQAKMADFGIRSATNRGDYATQMSLTSKKRDLEDEGRVIASTKAYTGAPEQMSDVAEYLNTKSGRVSMTDPDKNGLVRMMVINADGKAEYSKLTKQDQAKLFAAKELMDFNPTKALAMMKEVNAEFAAAVASENAQVFALGKNANDVAYKGGQLHNDAIRAANDTARVGIAAQGLRMRQAEASGRERSQIKPETVKALNDLNVQISEAEAAGDTGLAASLRGQYKRTYAMAATEMGKVMNPSEPQGRGVGLEKPVKVEDGGVRYLVGGQQMQTDGNGGYISNKGVLPSDRSAVMSGSKIPAALQGQVVWSDDGTAMMFRGMEFDPRDPRDMRELVQYAKQQGSNDIQVGELQKLPHGRAPERNFRFGPDASFAPPEGAPSIYEGPQAWGAYRAQQQNNR